jgi:hypothetical protein
MAVARLIGQVAAPWCARTAPCTGWSMSRYSGPRAQVACQASGSPRVLAGAVVVPLVRDCRWARIRACGRLSRHSGHVRSAAQVAFAKRPISASQEVATQIGVDRLPPGATRRPMREALIRQAGRVGGTAFHQGQGLHHLDRAARQDRAQSVLPQPAINPPCRDARRRHGRGGHTRRWARE